MFFASGNRIAAAVSKGLARDLEAGGCPSPLVLIDHNPAQHIAHRGRIAAQGNDVVEGEILFYRCVQDSVQGVIRRKAVLVGLVGSEFGGRGS
jgi:hypothetical protein